MFSSSPIPLIAHRYRLDKKFIPTSQQAPVSPLGLNRTEIWVKLWVQTRRCKQAFLVKIEFLRIQTFLFAIPRLKQMLGANAQLGHVIRYRLPALVDEIGGLALTFPNDEPPAFEDPLDAAIDDLHMRSPEDSQLEQQKDRPAALYRRGILARDGGHFQAVLADYDKARAFHKRATQVLSESLPGLRFEIRFSRLVDGSDPFRDEQSLAPLASDIADLPHFRLCQETGTDPATKDHPVALSRKATELRRYGVRFQRNAKSHTGRTDYDIVSLLRSRLPGLTSHICRVPNDLEQLAGPGGYIALIHADGNAIGQRRRLWAGDSVDRTPAGLIQHEACNEAFFHAMRCAVRASLIRALETVFTEAVLEENEYLPYQILMLGGDDLLLVCQPRFALDLVRHYALEIERHPLPWHNGEKRPISIGAGVVIAKHNIPFHRLHALAEQLAASAKRRYRRLKPAAKAEAESAAAPEISVVDWLVTTATWVENPETYRRRNQMVRYPIDGGVETLSLSARPYCVQSAPGQQSGAMTAGLETLTSLLDSASKLSALQQDRKGRRDVLARSQLKGLAQALYQGRQTATMRLRESPAALRDALKKHAGITLENTPDNLFLPCGDPPSKQFVTRLLDLVEVMEIEHLGRKT